MHGIVSQLCLIDLPFSVFFFFKQKTAYEIPLRLVGSEMCIRDRNLCDSNVWVAKEIDGEYRSRLLPYLTTHNVEVFDPFKIMLSLIHI